MNSHPYHPHRRKSLCALLTLALLAAAAAPAALAQKRKRKPVVVSFGQPNIWSLEQAHYLLARMHTQNLDLKARELADDALDPNAVNAVRINILKQLLEVGVEFDDAMRFQNQLLTRNASFNNARRLELTADRDRRQAESLQLAREIAALEGERAVMDNDKTATKEEEADKDAEIKQKKAEQAAVDKQIAFDNDELKTLGAQPSGTPQTPTVGSATATKLPASILDGLVEKNANRLLELAKDPKLNASTILDNHIQMQYEIIAKQLTLLRDEVGPAKFSDDDTIYINGRPIPDTTASPTTIGTKDRKSDKLVRLTFPMPVGDDVIVTVVPKEGAPVTKPFPNPLALKIDKVTVFSYDPPDKKTKGALLIKVEGAGFDQKPTLSVEGASKTESGVLDASSGEALVLLVDPKSSVVVTLKNPTTGQEVSTVVARTAAEGKKE